MAKKKTVQVRGYKVRKHKRKVDTSKLSRAAKRRPRTKTGRFRKGTSRRL